VCLLRGTDGSLNTIQNNFSLLALWVVLWLRWLATGLPLRRPRFDARPAYVRFVVGYVALRQALLRVLQLYPVSTIPPMLHPHLHLQTASTRRTSERSLGTFKIQTLLRKWGSI